MRVSLIAVWGALVLCGCSSPSVLIEQTNPPSTISTYVLPAFSSMRRTVSVGLDLTDCPENPVLTERGCSGVTHPVCPFPFRNIVKAECGKIIAANFRQPQSGESPEGTLRVSAERVVLKRCGIMTSCDIDLVFELSWNAAGRQPIVHHYEARHTSPFANEELVPDCVYRAVQETCRQFLRDLSLKATEIGARQSDSLKW